MLHLKAIGLVLIAILSVQVGAAFAKSLFPLIGPEATTVLRIWLGALMLTAFYRPWRTRLTRQAKQAIALYGISLGLMNFVFYLSIARIPLGLAVALEFLGPLTVAILGSRRPIDFLWVVMAGTGIYLVLPTSGLDARLDPLGIAQAL
ncbi:MAG TPA: EamA family transporter, partial [Bdellovibrionota bacterium]|nr:EamA family transporter [Bdellovibrionota bacterium]